MHKCHLSVATCTGNSSNCIYPNSVMVSDRDSFIKAISFDHVCGKFKGNYRSKDNFISSDCIPMDCDNDHSYDEKDWVTPFDVLMAFPDVCFYASYSRNHMKDKDCTPSAVLELEFENTSLTAAEEGTAAHAFCEHKLKKGLRMRSKRPVLDYYSDEMQECTDAYVDYVMKQLEIAK